SGSIDDASASGPVKEMPSSIDAGRGLFPHKKQGSCGIPRECHAANEISEGFAGGIQWGACPPCVVAGVGYIGEGPHRTGPAPMRVFGYFLHEQKVTQVWAGEAQEIVSRIAAIRGKKCCLPSRPAIRESQPIGAMRWHSPI